VFADKKHYSHKRDQSRTNIYPCLSSPHLSKDFNEIQRVRVVDFQNIAVPIFFIPYTKFNQASKDVFLSWLIESNKMVNFRQFGTIKEII